MIPSSITLASMLAFLLVGSFSLRRALFLLVVLFPFLPFYFAIPIGGSSGGAGFAAARGSAYVLFTLVLLSIVSDKSGWRSTFAAINRYRAFIWLFILMSMARLISTLLSQPLVAVLYWADELILLSTVLLLSTRVFLNPQNVEMIGRVILYVALVNAALSLVEKTLLDRHLLEGIINIDVSTVGENVLEGRSRYGAHRAQVLFDNPLSLAEYLLYSIGAILFWYKPSRPRGTINWIAMGVVLLGVLQTSARFPVVLLTVSFMANWALKFNSRLRSEQRTFSSFVLIIIVSTSTILGLYFVFNFETFLPAVEKIFFADGDRQGYASVVSRGFQYTVITREIFSNSYYGILGEGLRSDVVERLDVKLDNFYLRLLIEGGMVSVITFLLMLIGLTLNSAASMRKLRHLDLAPVQFRFFQRIFLGNVLFFSMFVVAKLFLSMNFNNYLLFLFAGAQIAVSYRLFSKLDYERISPA